MAAVRTMFAAAREEAALITTDLAVSARTTGIETLAQSSRMAEREAMNPVAVRQAAQAAVKESLGAEPSLLTQHLAHSPQSLPTLNSTLITPLDPTLTTTSSRHLTRILQRDLGSSVREALGNAGQTGVEEQLEQMEQLGEVAMAVRKGQRDGLDLRGALERAEKEVGA